MSSGFTAIAASGFHSLGLKDDGSVAAWGDNNYGQCNVPDPNVFIGIAAGGWHSLGLKDDGSVAAWGYNGEGQCNVPDPNGFVAIAAGIYHSLGQKMMALSRPGETMAKVSAMSPRPIAALSPSQRAVATAWA